jgi:osmotically-inducible protein OsmY
MFSQSKRSGAKTFLIAAAGIVLGTSIVGVPAERVYAQNASPATIEADQGTQTDQSHRAGDLAMTRKIRGELLKDSSLSQDARNIQIETVNGSVTLKGQVRTSKEKWKILAQAGAVAGSTHVTDQIQVAGE